MEDTIKDTVLKTFADFYAKGDLFNAWTELEKIRSSISPGVWNYNAGTLKAKMGTPAEARYYFLKAQAEGYREMDLENNLRIVEDQLEIKNVEKPLELSDYGIKFGLWAQQGFFTTLALAILVAGLLVLRRKKKILVLIVTVTLMMIPLGAEFWVKSWNKAVALESGQLLEGPSAIFASRGELPAGVLLVAKRAGAWYEVHYPARFRGWVKANGIKELE